MTASSASASRLSKSFSAMIARLLLGSFRTSASSFLACCGISAPSNSERGDGNPTSFCQSVAGDATEFAPSRDHLVLPRQLQQKPLEERPRRQRAVASQVHVHLQQPF